MTTTQRKTLTPASELLAVRRAREANLKAEVEARAFQEAEDLVQRLADSDKHMVSKTFADGTFGDLPADAVKSRIIALLREAGYESGIDFTGVGADPLYIAFTKKDLAS